MQLCARSSSIFTSSTSSISEGIEQPHTADERAYQAMTVAAILLVLGSVWVF
jgi:hypothetical protein